MPGECDHFLDPAEQRRWSLDGLSSSLSTLRLSYPSSRKPSTPFSDADPSLLLIERQTLPSLEALFGQSRESQASFVNVPSPTPSPSGPQEAASSNAVLPSSPALPIRKYRKPSKSILNFLDMAAVIVSITCVGLALATLSPHLHYATQLQYTGQITIVGFLLSLMNHCLQRVSPFLFMLIEARFGPSGLQNYDGLIRWSLWAERLRLTWRASIVFLFTLPLILSAIYKQFTGGTGWVQVAASKGYYGPTAAQGLKHAGGQTIMASAVHPYMAASRHDAGFPDLTKGTQAYGYNILLLSNTSAAALDSPLPNYTSHLQSQLTNIAIYYLEAAVRGTVTHYNSTVDSHRRDPSFWRKYFPAGPELRAATDIWPWNRWYFGWQMLSSASDNSAYAWDPSWSFMGYYSRPEGITQPHDIKREFEQTARGFDTHRHACRGKWKVTRNSIELVSGSCDPRPLKSKYQYLSNCQLPLTHYVEILAEFLGPFVESRKDSPWLLPTFSVVTAAMHSSHVAASEGVVWIQPGGPIWRAWNPGKDPHFRYNETYLLDDTLSMEVPTMRASPGLYFVIILQPILTIMAFVSTLWLHNTPISRDFCLVSVLAGVDKDSLKLLEGASFSGKLDRSMRLQITALEETSASGGRLPRLEYVIEQSAH